MLLKLELHFDTQMLLYGRCTCKVINLRVIKISNLLWIEQTFGHILKLEILDIRRFLFKQNKPYGFATKF